MRYRWKLLILLLTISLIPILVLRIFGVRNVHLLAENLVSEARAHLIADAENRLRFLVDSYSAWILAGREHFETALMFQAREVEHCLAADVPLPPEVYFAEDFNEGRDLPHDTTLSPNHFRTRSDGTFDLLNFLLHTGFQAGARRGTGSCRCGYRTPVSHDTSLQKPVQALSKLQLLALYKPGKRAPQRLSRP
ncbi:hypothetical protein ES703_52160 [subsurface metagenome]